MAKGQASPKPTINVNATAPEIDTSLESWIYNTRSILQEPLTIILVTSLLVTGTFAEICPRKSLDFLDSIVGKTVLFAIPLILALFIDWPTGLLAAVVSLIIFTKLTKPLVDEGFVDGTSENNNEVQTTSIISNTHRWFVEKVLGEVPVAISSDRILTSAVQDKDTRTSSSSSMNTNNTSDSSSSSQSK